MHLKTFNEAPAEALNEQLSELTECPELAQILTHSRPYRSLDELVETCHRSYAELSDEVVRRSVDKHPPIGEKVAAGSRSEEEQSRVAETGEDAVSEIRRLNPIYQEKFGYVFLICAGGLTGKEILDALRERLNNEPETEWNVARAQLDAINERRLRTLITE